MYPSPRRSAWIKRLALAAGLLVSFAASAQDIVVGQVAPFTGPQAISGLSIRAGAQLYFDSLNAHGGIRGHRVRLESRDDGQKAPETVKQTKALIDEQAPVAMICSISTSSLEAVANDGVLKRTKTPMIGAVSGAGTVLRAPGMFITKASYHDEIDRLFKQIAGFGQKRVALVYQDDAFGQDVHAGVQESAKRYGLELVADAGYARNTTTLDKAVADVIKADPQVVFVGATTAAAIEFVRQYRTNKGLGTLFGLSVVDTDAMLKQLGPDAVRGYGFTVVQPLAQQKQRAVVREYLQLREASKDPNLSARSIEGFIAAKTLATILAGVPNPTAAAVYEAATRAKLDVGDFAIDFTTHGQPGSSYVDFAMFGMQGRIVQ